MISLSVAFEKLIIFHNDSFGIIFLKSALNKEIDFKFIEKIRLLILINNLKIPQKEGQIVHAIIDTKNIIIRAGKYAFTLLVLSTSPNRKKIDALKDFGIRFEARWNKELEGLYMDYNGDIEIFKKDTETRPNINYLVEDVFHLSYALPHILNSIQIEETRLNPLSANIWKHMKEISENSEYVYLQEVIDSCSELLSVEKSLIDTILCDFIARNYLKLY